MNQSVQTTVDAVLESSWSLPIWLCIVLAVAAASFASWIYATERGRANRPQRILLAAIRFCLLLLVLWMLLGWSWIRFTSDRPELVIVVDRSASMNTQDIDSNSVSISRFLRSIEILERIRPRVLQEIQSRYQTRWYSIGQDVEQIQMDWGQTDSLRAITVDDDQSKLGDALLQILGRQTGSAAAAIVLFTDGVNTSGSALADAAHAARASAIPIFSIAVGKQFSPPDIRLADLLLDRDAYLGDQVVVEFAVIASDVKEASTTVTLSDLTTGRILDETQVTHSESANQQLARLSFIPQTAGEFKLQIEAASLQDEQNLQNNSLTTSVNVQDKAVKVLMVFQRPSYEFRFLKSLLERTTQHEESSNTPFHVDVVLQDADAEYVQQDKSAIRLVPSDTQTLESYDVFVFGDFNPTLISRRSQQLIYNSVTTRGAGCIFVFSNLSAVNRIAGWPLAGLLPILPADPTIGLSQLQRRSNSDALTFRWRPTPVGSNALPLQLGQSPDESQQVWNLIPELHSVAPVSRIKPGAQILANAVSVENRSATPVLITQFAGSGRSALQATDETYQWTTVGGSDIYHQRYWGQMLRWLGRGKLRSDRSAELVVTPPQARVGQTIDLHLTLGNATPPTSIAEVTIEAADGQRTATELRASDPTARVLTGFVNDLPPGRYRAYTVLSEEDEVAMADFVVSAPPSEQANLRADLDSLSALSALSRGQLILEQDAESVFENLPRGQTTRLGNLPPKPIWNSPWIALLFVFLITCEWLLRRKSHML